MDRARIDAEHLIARYLADQLSEEQRAEFEARMHSDPELVREVDATARFKFALRDLEVRGELEKLPRRRLPITQPAWLAAAASIVVLLAAALVWISRGPPEPQMIAASLAELAAPGAALPRLARSVAVIHTRSAVDAQIELPPQDEVLELVLEVNQSAEVYDVVLRRPAGEGSAVVGAARNVPRSPTGHVSIFLRPASLPPARYELSVGATSGTAAPQEVFVLELTR
jgi:hypothetical protein